MNWPSLWILLLVTLLITVFANRPPTFTNNIDLTVIKENTPIGTTVFKLEGKDYENSTVYYGIEGTDKLTVDPLTGVVTVAASIDRERNDSLKFFVTLEDIVGGGNDNNLVRVPVTAIVLDENDNVPRFQQVPYQATVSEDAPVGTTIYKGINVTDADDVGSVLQVICSFHIQFPDACDKFKVVPQSGAAQNALASIVLNKKLDYTERHVYQVKLLATDGQHNVTTAVIINVKDVQNRPPVFISSLTGIVNEDDPVGTLVMKVVAKDGDQGVPRQVVYELVTNPDDSFVIDSKSGELRTQKRLDKEIFSATNGVVTMKIKAAETVNGIPQNSSETVSVATITVTIKDVNDEAPTFNKISYTVNVNENIPNGTPLPNLDMFVHDTDVGSNSVFNIDLMDSSEIFSVEPHIATGSTSISIRVAKGPLDYENPNQRKYILLVIATEAFTNPKLSSTATVTVNILDTNDNSPQFEKPSYEATIAEDAAAGAVVATIIATDRDTGIYGEKGIIYSLFGNGAERFSVQPNLGIITVALCETPGFGNCLDFESRQSYYLSYQAIDNKGKGRTSVVPLTISLADANDNPPVFLQDTYSAIVDEGASKFHPPLRTQAKDIDVSSVISYSIVAGNSLNLFAMNSKTGEITIINPAGLDVSSLRTDLTVLTIQASDGGANPATATVKITIRDSNNNNPLFQKATYYASIPESSSLGTIVEQVSASDDDTGINALLSYRILKGAFDDFAINSSSGIVTVSNNSKLDYDERKQYKVEIIAIDGGNPPRTGTTTLNVHILNYNDKAPYFTPTTQRTQVSEGIEPGHIFYKLKAKDPDISTPESLKYHIEEPITAIDKDGRQVNQSIEHYKAFFDVNSNTGDVLVAHRLNRNIAAVVTLTVVVTDVSASPHQTGKGILVVTVVDVNDFPPSFARPWTPNQPEITVNAMEEQPVGSVITTLVATDPDSNIAGYKLVTENKYLTIDKLSGTLSVKSRIDYEEIKEIKTTVVAYDTGVPQLSAIALITAKIININDNDPIFSENSYYATILENSPPDTQVLTITATDLDIGDFGKIHYSLSGEESKNFMIDQKGVIYVAHGSSLDREISESITMQVVATDQGADVSTRRITSVPVYITLEDVNDNSPKFESHEYEASIVSNIPLDPPSPVIQIAAVDNDEGNNGRIYYDILDGDDDGIFGIDPETGIIYPTRALHNNREQYKLKVEARDLNGTGPNADEAAVYIKIVEVNQDKPRFIVPALLNATVEIPENQSIANFLIMTVQAVDSDKGENGRILYHLKVGGSNMEETAEFHLNPISGELRTKMILDREKREKYELVLAAKDNGSPTAFETLQFLTVVLKDVDDNIPLFQRSQSTNPYVFTIEENLGAGTPIGQISALDKDVGDNALIYYYIIDSDSSNNFVIDKIYGVISSNVSFDREEHDMYELVVKASSNPDYIIFGEKSLSPRIESYRENDLSLALVRILITDVNDNIPHFIDAPYLAGLRVTTQVGDVVATVNAVDLDEGPESKLIYRLENVNLYRRGIPGSVRPVPSPFNVTSDGKIIALQLMSQFEHGRFRISVIAREGTYPHRVARTTVKLWVYESNQLVRVIVAKPPEQVHEQKQQIAAFLSNATGGEAVIDDIKYHVTDKQKILRHWTDLYIHVVDNDDKMLPVSTILDAVDSNAKLLELQYDDLHIHKIVPAHVIVMEEEFDMALMILSALLVILFVGILTMLVCCHCLKSWYRVKMKEVLVRNDEVDAGNTTENPLWNEQKLKLYEEQELSMSMTQDQDNMITTEAAINFHDDTESAMYATLRKSTTGSIGTDSRLGESARNEYATLNGRRSLNGLSALASQHDDAQMRQRIPSSEQGHEYHELRARHDISSSENAKEETTNLTSSDPTIHRSNLTIDEDGEPVLVAELL